MRILLLLCLFGAVLSGCKKRPGTTAPASTQPAPPNPEVDIPNLTIAVRAYVMTQGKPPATLDDLVKAGCIARLPTAPAGKKYAIDAKRAQAVLVSE
jgi:hypothetical protein